MVFMLLDAQSRQCSDFTNHLFMNLSIMQYVPTPAKRLLLHTSKSRCYWCLTGLENVAIHEGSFYTYNFIHLLRNKHIYTAILFLKDMNSRPAPVLTLYFNGEGLLQKIFPLVLATKLMAFINVVGCSSRSQICAEYFFIHFPTSTTLVARRRDKQCSQNSRQHSSPVIY